MKNAISVLLSLVFLFASPVRAQWAAVLAGSPPSGAQAAAYFGNCNSDGTPLAGYIMDWYGTRTFYNVNAVVPFTCPGTGTRTVDGLAVYASTRGAPHGYIRLAVYDTSLNLLFQGSAAILVNSTEAWFNHTTFSGTAQVTGGTNYLIAVTVADSYPNVGSTSPGGSSPSREIVTDYTGGFPDPIGAGSTDGKRVSVRIHVQ